MKKFLASFIFATSFLISLPSYSALVNIIDNGNYTTDTLSGLDWLDLTITRGMSYNQVVKNINSGGSLSNWRLATVTELNSLVSNSEWKTNNNSQLWSYLGGTLAIGYAEFIQGIYGPVIKRTFGSLEYISVPNAQLSTFKSGFRSYRQLNSYLEPDFSNPGLGAFLVRDAQVSAVPVPAAAWMLAPVILGFMQLRFRVKHS